MTVVAFFRQMRQCLSGLGRRYGIRDVADKGRQVAAMLVCCQQSPANNATLT